MFLDDDETGSKWGKYNAANETSRQYWMWEYENVDELSIIRALSLLGYETTATRGVTALIGVQKNRNVQPNLRIEQSGS